MYLRTVFLSAVAERKSKRREASKSSGSRRTLKADEVRINRETNEMEAKGESHWTTLIGR